MVEPTTNDRVSFTEYIVLTDAAHTFGGALHDLLHRLQVDEQVIATSLEITLVRRMLSSELDRLQLSPRTAVWFEVRGNGRGAHGRPK